MEVQGVKMIDFFINRSFRSGQHGCAHCIFKCLAKAHSSDNTSRFRESDHTIRNRRFRNIALRHRSRVPVCISKAYTVKQGSPNFLKLRASSCAPINA